MSKCLLALALVLSADGGFLSALAAEKQTETTKPNTEPASQSEVDSKRMLRGAVKESMPTPAFAMDMLATAGVAGLADVNLALIERTGGPLSRFDVPPAGHLAPELIPDLARGTIAAAVQRLETADLQVPLRDMSFEQFFHAVEAAAAAEH
uniref:Uncharacterized protein n=1 Tax=Peronospora matthiolae TaxID=2874970 RepID=A0AAV1U8N2_9STRA